MFSNVRTGLRAMQFVFIGCSQYQKKIFPSFSITFPHPQFVVYHFVSLESSLFSTGNILLTYTLFPLAFSTLTEDSALFFYAPHITCICHIPLILWYFSRLLFLSFASEMQMLAMFSWGWCSISTSQSVLRYIALVDLIQFFPSFFSFSVTFFGNNYTSFIK